MERISSILHTLEKQITKKILSSYDASYNCIGINAVQEKVRKTRSYIEWINEETTQQSISLEKSKSPDKLSGKIEGYLEMIEWRDDGMVGSVARLLKKDK